MFEFFLAQAEQLAQWGQLEIATLELEGHLLATLYGFSAKGVYYAHKIGYDPRFAHFSPGQVMFWNILERLHADGRWQAVDCLGPFDRGHLALAPGDVHHRPRSGGPCGVWSAGRQCTPIRTGGRPCENGGNRCQRKRPMQAR